jgi:hypothetical protein
VKRASVPIWARDVPEHPQARDIENIRMFPTDREFRGPATLYHTHLPFLTPPHSVSFAGRRVPEHPLSRDKVFSPAPAWDDSSHASYVPVVVSASVLDLSDTSHHPVSYSSSQWGRDVVATTHSLLIPSCSVLLL